MTKGLKRCDEVFKYLKTYEWKHLRMPTRQEACYDLKIFPGAFDRIITRLISEGKLKRIVNGIPFRILK